MKKKLLCGLLTLCMLLTLLPLSVLADPSVVEDGQPGIVKFSGFRAAATDSNTYNQDMTNCMYIALSVGKNEHLNYDYTYQCVGSDDASNIQETKVDEGKITTGGVNTPYARWQMDFDDLKPGKYTIRVYEKGTFGTDQKKLLGSDSFDLVKYTFDPNGKGTITAGEDNGGQMEGDKFVAYGEPNVFYFHTYVNLTVTPTEAANGDSFIGWSLKSSGYQEDPHKDLIGTSMPKPDTGYELTLYAVYGTPKITKLVFSDDTENLNGGTVKVETYSITYTGINLKPGYTAENNTVAKIKLTNGGNQPLKLPLYTSYAPFEVEYTYNDSTLEGSWISLPNANSSVTLTLKLPVGKDPGTYSLYKSFRVGYTVCSISVTATVSVAGVTVTLADAALTKGYGQSVTSDELAAGATVVWTSPDENPGPNPTFDQLGITLESTGMAETAAASEDGYAISVAGSSPYTVTLANDPKLKVTKAKPSPSTGDANPEVSVMVGHELGDVLPGVTFTNPYNHADVPGDLTWDEDTTYDEVGSQTAAFTFTPSDPDNYEEYHGTANVTVTAKNVAVLTPDIVDPKYTYNATSHPVTFTASKSHDYLDGDLGQITVKYEKEKDGGYEPETTEAPIDAGTYKVTATMAETPKFAAATATTTLTISPREVNVNGAIVNPKTYNGKVDDGTVKEIELFRILDRDKGEADVDLEACKVTYASADASLTQSVTISNITLTGARAANYTLKNNVYQTRANVNPATVSVELADGPVEKPYGQLLELNASHFTFTGAVEGETVNAEYISDGEDAAAAVGSHDVTVELNTGNYVFDGKAKTATVKGGVEVTKVKLTDENGSVSAGYGHSGNALSSVSLAGSFTNPYNNEDVPGELTWTDGAATLPTTDDADTTYEAGWTFTLADEAKDRYEPDTVTGTVTVTVKSKYVINFEVDSSTLTATYDGETHPVTVNVLKCDFTHDPGPSIDDDNADEYTVVSVEYAPEGTANFTTDAPTDAGVYDVKIVIEPINGLEATHSANGTDAKLTVAQADPDVTGVTFAPVLEGTLLSEVRPTSLPTDLNGRQLTGEFSWTEAGVAVTEDNMEYSWQFNPDDPNYRTVSGSSVITLADDTRSVTAAVYNLPEAYGDYAVITGVSGGFKAGDSVAFYDTADCENPISELVAVNEIDGDIRVEVSLEAGALDADGGSIYVKVNGKKAQPVEVAYDKAPDISSSAVSLTVGDALPSTLAPNDSKYTVSGVTWTVPVNDVLSADENGAYTAVAAGTVTVTAGVTFDHPDSAKSGEGVVVEREITVTVSADADVDPTPGTDPNPGTDPGSSTVTPSSDTVTLPEESEGGDVTLSTTTASEGDEVVVTPDPDEGKRVGSVTVKDADGNEVKVTVHPDGTFTFDAPAKLPVSVEVTFEDAVDAVDAFNDIDSETWYTDALTLLYNHPMRLISGDDSSNYNPSGVSGRAHLWQLLANLSGAELEIDGPWYSGAQAWAKANNVSDGSDPTDPATREQMITMLYNFLGKPAPVGDVDMSAFADSEDIHGYCLDAFKWAVSAGLVHGTDTHALNPLNSATRADMAVFFALYLESIMK